jgi:hypothetical protein
MLTYMDVTKKGTPQYKWQKALKTARFQGFWGVYKTTIITKDELKGY